MVSPQAQAQAVKSAISGGNATASTVTTLQSLLSAETKSTTVKAATNTQVRKTTGTRKAATTRTTSSKKAQDDESVDIHHDKLQSLARKERYTLATEVVNLTLKKLTESLQSRRKSNPRDVAEDVDAKTAATPRKLSRTSSSVSRSALQPRSGNTTPVTPTANKPKTSSGKNLLQQESTTSFEASPHVTAIGECSRLGFAFLRSANTKQLGVKDLPTFQLENGMLALAGKLLAHGLESLAVKELRVVKARLEAVGKGKPIGPPERETLASLLLVKVDIGMNPAALPLIITHQSLVLRAISLSSKTATIEACVGYLELSEPSSPSNFIRVHSAQSGDKDKAGRLLENLSSTILGLCPSLSSKVDDVAVNRELSPAPEAILRLQSIGLRSRKQWWELVGHRADLDKELLDPALRCISAFIRRTRKRRTAQQIYDAASQFGQDVISNCDVAKSKVLFTLHRTLASLAEDLGQNDEAQKWSAALNKQTENLKANHAQRISAVARRLATQSSTAASAALPELVISLKGTIDGNASDHECLLVDLSRLLTKIKGEHRDEENLQHLWALAVAFALRFVRSYPGTALEASQIIIYQALRHSAPSDAATSWIDREAVQVLVDTGALQTLTKEEKTGPLSNFWSSSTAAITLGRALRLLIVRAVKTGSTTTSESLFDDERLACLERGLVLEYQLSVAIEHASKSKYHAVLRKLIPQLLQKLDCVYSASKHPLRRASIAVQVLRLNEELPTIVTRKTAEYWETTQLDTETLLHDSGLRSYADDVSLALKLTKIFHAGRPSIKDLGPILSAWQLLLDDVSSSSELESRVWDFAALRLSLQSIANYFGAYGEDAHRLSVLTMVTRWDATQSSFTAGGFDASIQSARQWLYVGSSEKAGAIFAQSEKHLSSSKVPILAKICWHVAYAEYLLAIDNLEKCRCALEAAQSLRSQLLPKEVTKDQRAAYERAHGEGWLLQSKYNLATGASHSALVSAKHAMKIVNSTWCRLEKGHSDETPRMEEDATPGSEALEGIIAELSTGVSKLQLLPKGTDADKEAKSSDIKGATFWPLVPLLSKTLVHLSDMYAHHGLFSEANYYSTKAVDITASMGSSVLLSRIRSHRASLLALAGSLGDAELCLIGSESVDLASSPLATVERLQAQATLRAKDGALEDAAKLFDNAGQLVSKMQSEFIPGLTRFESSQMDAFGPKPVLPTPAARPARTTTRTRKATGKTAPAAVKPSTRSLKFAPEEQPSYLLQKLHAQILLQRVTLGLTPSAKPQEVLMALTPLGSTVVGTLQQRRVQYRSLLDRAAVILQSDIAYNILFDSTLSIPALFRPTVTDDTQRTASPARKVVSAKANTKAGQRKAVAKPDFKALLQEARACLLVGHSSVSRYCTSAETHIEGSCLLESSAFCASIDATTSLSSLNSFQTGLALDFPRINALQLEQSASLADANHELRTTPFEWPSVVTETPEPQLNAAAFQEEYINTIPKPWTAVSLTLDESCTSLYVARYRADQTPFVVRLPFSRHQDEELGNEAFDYAAGKEELQEIIQLSNASCHNNGDLSAKGAKSNWWSEREALDRRLQELLINIEDMWFGGFKGVFSPRARQPELLSRFHLSLEASLDRHLPSRQTSKGRNVKLTLDHNVTELFVNLGSDNDGAVDLDEPISDLLYFVVDTLQFNGERNAYDEIDFDAMTIEVLDALRSYHEAVEVDQSGQQHVVLVLDKRLQAFPWENLPCLEQISVSRVGSMLSLRDCIAAMQTQRNADGHHVISRKSGAYILNPSSDLANTQSILQPALSTAASADGANWSSIVNQAPSEEDFKSTLEKFAMTLYFGHGAGSQYIRSRTIKRLKKCSEVVWLMGCSSGAVTEYGELEPQAVPLAYLNAGTKKASSSLPDESTAGAKCLAIVATLWDVTDKDIDRFSLTIGEEWGLWSPPAEPAKVPSKTPKKRERLLAPSTPRKAPKTPKTPRLVKTPATAKTPARSRSRSAAGDRSVSASLAGAVARSRDACYLRYLNGAAPVVYGVPVYLGD